jgi:hypothetical protein
MDDSTLRSLFQPFHVHIQGEQDMLVLMRALLRYSGKMSDSRRLIRAEYIVRILLPKDTILEFHETTGLTLTFPISTEPSDTLVSKGTL